MWAEFQRFVIPQKKKVCCTTSVFELFDISKHKKKGSVHSQRNADDAFPILIKLAIDRAIAVVFS